MESLAASRRSSMRRSAEEARSARRTSSPRGMLSTTGAPTLRLFPQRHRAARGWASLGSLSGGRTVSRVVEPSGRSRQPDGDLASASQSRPPGKSLSNTLGSIHPRRSRGLLRTRLPGPRAIRRSTAPDGPPILLLYGQTGVGKSSLLQAGLQARLAAGGSNVRYRNRNQGSSLLKLLREAVGATTDKPSLCEAWRAEEKILEARPLFVILDQIEDAITRPDPSNPCEVEQFAAALREAVGDQDNRPKGKLILGFRKEWLDEVEMALAKVSLLRKHSDISPASRPARNSRGGARTRPPFRRGRTGSRGAFGREGPCVRQV